jgi:hypothetical protein
MLINIAYSFKPFTEAAIIILFLYSLLIAHLSSLRVSPKYAIVPMPDQFLKTGGTLYKTKDKSCIIFKIINLRNNNLNY